MTESVMLKRKALKDFIRDRNWDEGKPVDPQRGMAYATMFYAKKQKKVKQPDKCEDCFKPFSYLEAHHDNYRRPLDVTWLCKACHANRRIIKRRLARAKQKKAKANG